MGETILSPNIRLSHPVKGRVPEAKGKPANELQEHEKTNLFERMAFVIEIPSIQTNIAGNPLNLVVGGVKAYNLDNLYNSSGADQHFKVFVGFQNMVCTNMCVSTDGYLSQLKIKSLDQLGQAIQVMLHDYNAVAFSEQLKSFVRYSLTERQFANLVGRCKLYKYMSDFYKAEIPELLFGGSQINTVCKEYYQSEHFAADSGGTLNLWSMYNLFTGANKSSYIDTFLDRSTCAFNLVGDIKDAMDGKKTSWYLQ